MKIEVFYEPTPSGRPQGVITHPPAVARLAEQAAPLDFSLPPHLEASGPPEARGLARDEVRLMVSYISSGEILHTRFRRLPEFLAPGDVLVINTSKTLPAALPAQRRDGGYLELHLSTHLPGGSWSVELRQVDGEKSLPFTSARPGETLALPGGGAVTLLAPYQPVNGGLQGEPGRVRLWKAELRLPQPLEEYLARHGFPIRYSYVEGRWPLHYYQTVYATQPGSAEMPSAGRAFTAELITRLVAQGVIFAPLLLHTGVASLEEGEPPYPERYRVPEKTASLVNAAHREGRRVIAVGTTAVRALETVTARTGKVVRPGEGWTSLVITPERGLRAVKGLLTGLHEPRSSHLSLLAALAGAGHLRQTYAAALEQEYLWHEFGDLHLILP
jgi:S-adenosylmethionine:tRNA ribosyltransferase-isomerase